MLKRFIFIISTLLLLTVACEDSDDATQEKTEPEVENQISNTVKFRNLWVRDIMQEVYLWESQMPDNLAPFTEPNTFDFFDKMVYEIEDKWSWISDDYFETMNLYSGINTTAGHNFSLYVMPDNNTIYGIVEYVMPNSPAQVAGIERGDIFTKVNNIVLDYTSYYKLVTLGGTYTIQFDTLVAKDEDISVENLSHYKTVELTEISNFQEDPILIDTIYEIESYKIGYFMYNSFLSEFNTAKDDAFSRFKAQGVNDLIIDLRYNSGGSVAAEEHLANLIAPKDQVGEIFAVEIWNSLYNNYWTSTYGSDYLNTRIKEADSNMDLKGKLIGITTSSTASASEGLLNGLDPLLDFTQIGTPTHGKYTAMAPLPDEDSVWVVIPIIFKTTNRDGVSVRNGMTPDVQVNDDPLDGYQLGDIRETMLAEAIKQITGEATVKSSKVNSKSSSKSIGRFKNNDELIPQPMLYDKKLPAIIRN